MNGFGRLYRIALFGESHGPEVGVVVDGCPAGLPLVPEDFKADLERRRGGRAGTTRRVEEDMPVLVNGVLEGRATGAPILIRFPNRDVDSSAYDGLDRTPRPGHADLVARSKFGSFNDHRGGGMFSGRLTVGLVAAGVVAKKLLAGISIRAELIQAGGRDEIDAVVESASTAGDSVGGLVECRVTGLPVGLGEPLLDPLEGSIAHLVFAVGGVRGIEFGSGFASAGMRGSQCNDAILDPDGRTATNHAGGVNGGLSNGNELLFRVAVKPTSSISLPQETVDLEKGERTELSVQGRHDACIALRVPPVIEAVAAVVLADAMLLEQRIPRIWTD